MQCCQYNKEQLFWEVERSAPYGDAAVLRTPAHNTQGKCCFGSTVLLFPILCVVIYRAVKCGKCIKPFPAFEELDTSRVHDLRFEKVVPESPASPVCPNGCIIDNLFNIFRPNRRLERGLGCLSLDELFLMPEDGFFFLPGNKSFPGWVKGWTPLSAGGGGGGGALVPVDELVPVPVEDLSPLPIVELIPMPVEDLVPLLVVGGALVPFWPFSGPAACFPVSAEAVPVPVAVTPGLTGTVTGGGPLAAPRAGLAGLRVPSAR